MALLEDGDLDGPSSRACHIAELREKAWGLSPPPGTPVRGHPGLRVLQRQRTPFATDRDSGEGDTGSHPSGLEPEFPEGSW
jgi:hypothetical protein